MYSGYFFLGRLQIKPSQAKPSQAKPSQAKPSQAKQSKAKLLTEGRDLRFAQVDVPLSVSHSRVWPRSWAL